MDSFCLKAREDVYARYHMAHFLLCYGYDSERGIVNVVDHQYRNSYFFEEKEMLTDELLAANEQYKIFFKKGHYTCRALCRRKFQKTAGKGILSFAGKARFEESRKNARENAEELKRILTGEREKSVERDTRMVRYFQNMKMGAYCLARQELFALDKEKRATLEELTGTYAYFWSLVLKMSIEKDYDYAKKNRQRILRKLGQMTDAENRVYGFLEEYYDGVSKH